MFATSVRLSDKTAERLEYLSARTGRSKSYYLREAIESNIERLIVEYEILQDLEDIKTGRARTYSSDEVRKSLGLES